MIVHQGISTFTPLPYAVVTEGTFDGVHIGHQKILTKVVESTLAARAANHPEAQSVLLSFWPHPRMVLSNDSGQLRLLSTIAEKMRLVASFGIDHFVMIPFDKAFSSLSPEAYVRQILVETINTRKLIIGYDHRFGNNREGDFTYLKSHEKHFGFEVEEIPRQDIDEIGVSSTKIRTALTQGRVDIAASYLGYYYELSGTVVKGNQIGRTIGFPTANLHINENYKLIPADGIYAVEVLWSEKTYQGMLYIGIRSTIGSNLQRTIEVNIFDFNQDIYEAHISIKLVAYLRGEVRFTHIDEMQQQLTRDKEAAIAALKQHKLYTN